GAVGELVMATGETPPITAPRERDQGLRDESMGQLCKQLSDELSTLVRQELRLAQAEMTEKGKKAGIGIGMFGGAGVVSFLAAPAPPGCLLPPPGNPMHVVARAR